MEHSLKLKTQYTFKPPFDNLQSDLYYKISTESTIEALINDGVDVYNLVYKPNGVSLDVYNTDFIEGVSIVSLDDGINITPVPSKYLTSRQDVSRYPYTPKGLTVNIGNLTDDESLILPTLSNEITKLIKHYLGITPVIQTIELGDAETKTEAEHVTIKTARTVIKQTTPACQTENAKLLVENAKLRTANQEMADVIVNNIAI